MVVAAELGVDPWNVFHIGITLHTPLTIGRATQIVAFFIIILGWMMKVPPGIGTFLNMYFWGFFVDLVGSIGIIKPPSTYFYRWIMFLAGTCIVGIGTGIYINAKLGAGPRDGFTLGMSAKTGKSVSFVRTMMELCAVFSGWLLGGPVGLGTMFYSVTIGKVMEVGLKCFKLPHHYFPEKRKMLQQ